MSDDKKQFDVAQQALQLKNNMPALLEITTLQAKVTRHKFLALVEQGFTEEQALELCK